VKSYTVHQHDLLGETYPSLVFRQVVGYEFVRICHQIALVFAGNCIHASSWLHQDKQKCITSL